MSFTQHDNEYLTLHLHYGNASKRMRICLQGEAHQNMLDIIHKSIFLKNPAFTLPSQTYQTKIEQNCKKKKYNNFTPCQSPISHQSQFLDLAPLFSQIKKSLYKTQVVTCYCDHFVSVTCQQNPLWEKPQSTFLLHVTWPSRKLSL